ncbi:glycosyltransferase family 2 protein [Allorhizobium borbori]|uniref:Glycosyltransferase 2-like domain-containing protein n=1 Tax=Allorhizobium borbori TaxID=485907 RepID=A0A7W6K8H4_9HYPH|nr:glycosyltransferase family 2 protein [Allorhizobium borbori]MBB4105977.1 hypothetical protein [Allorhizobium borbori]
MTNLWKKLINYNKTQPKNGSTTISANSPVRTAFDNEEYLKANADVRAAGMNAFHHYFTYGISEGRRAPKGFHKRVLDLARAGDSDAISFRRHQLSVAGPGGMADIELDEVMIADNMGTKFPLPVGTTITMGIVLFNNELDEIKRLLRSIARSKGLDGVTLVTTVINNGAPLEDEMIEMIESFGVKILENPDGNIGSSAGHTRLMKHAFTDLDAVAYMTLNPDGFFHPQALERMVRMAHRHEWTAAIEAAQLPNENGKYFNPDTFDTEWAVTACAMFTRKIWEKVGGFDPNIFLYCDDVDYGWEIRRAGFTVKYCPWAYYFHDYASRTAVSAFFRQNRLEAGRYLGHKWRNPKFREMCEEQLIKFGFYEAVEAMPPIDHIAPLPNGTEVANFKNDFHFAQKRW